MPDDYYSVVEAVSAANSGDAVFVKAGAYYESVYITKQIDLIGAGPQETVIFSSGSEGTIVVESEGAEISGFTLKNDNSGSRYTVNLRDSRSCQISQNVIYGGIGITDSSFCKISDNRFEPNMYYGRPGIQIVLSNDIELEDNVVNDCILGIDLSRAYSCILRRNRIQNCEHGFSLGGSHNIDTSNTVDGKPVIYLDGKSNLDIGPETYPEIGYLYIRNSKNVHFHDLYINGSNEGLNIASCTYIHLDNLTLHDNEIGVNLDRSSNCRIIGCRMDGNQIGVLSGFSYAIVFEDNLITGDECCSVGLDIGVGSYWTISRNVISGNYKNLVLRDCQNFMISKNDIINTIEGPPTWSPSRGMELWDCAYNSILHNNLVDNEEHVAIIRGDTNTWNAESTLGGNYWADYEGQDLDQDGIGDSAYVIESGNVDNYPLMHPYPWQDIEIDRSTTSADRCDVGSTQNISFHARWSRSHLPVVCNVYVNGTPYKTDTGGWAHLNYTSSSVMRTSWQVTNVSYHGKIDFTVSARKAEIIWDMINISLSSPKERNDLGTVGIIWSGNYSYDGTPFHGEVLLNDTVTHHCPGLYGYRVQTINDFRYGLQKFEANNASAVFDRVEITLSVPSNRVGVGTPIDVEYKAVYEYGGETFQGRVKFDDILISNTVGVEESRVSEIEDDVYGITQFKSNSVSVIFDKVHLVLTDDRVDVGCPYPIEWTGWYEYDNRTFTGSINLNQPPGSDDVGRKHFFATSIQDPLYGIEEFTTNRASVIYDRVKINVSAIDSHLDVGQEVELEVRGVYEFDNQAFNGSIMLNESTLALQTPGKLCFTASGISDPLYGLSAFTSDVESIIWDRVLIVLRATDSRIDIRETGSIEMDAHYEYDGKDFGGTIQLNDTLRKDRVGYYYYTVDGISGGPYGLTAFSANVVSIIFDEVLINLSITDSRIDVGREANIAWQGRYAYDGARYVGTVNLNDSLTKNRIGKWEYTVSSISDTSYGLSTFVSNSVRCIYDKVQVVLKPVGRRIDVGTDDFISTESKYLFDGQGFEGEVSLNDTIKGPAFPCKKTYSVNMITDSRYGLTNFISVPVSIIFDKVNITLSSGKPRLDVESRANISVSAVYMYDNTPLSGEVLLNDTQFTQWEVGKRGYRAKAFVDELYGLSEFESNSLYVIFDKVEINLSSEFTRVSADRNASLSYEGWYLYDRTPFKGDIELNQPILRGEMGSVTYRAAGIQDSKYELSKFETNQVMVIFDRISMDQEIRTGTPGVFTVNVSLRFETDRTPVSNASVAINGISAREIGDGVYLSKIKTWNLRPKIETVIQASGFGQSRSEAKVWSTGNGLIILSGTIFFLAVLVVAYFWRRTG